MFSYIEIKNDHPVIIHREDWETLQIHLKFSVTNYLKNTKKHANIIIC